MSNTSSRRRLAVCGVSSIIMCVYMNALVQVCRAQIGGSIRGAVHCQDTGMPARFARINVASGGYSVSLLAKYDGTFSIGGLPAGKYTVSSQYAGYIDNRTEGEIRETRSSAASTSGEPVQYAVVADGSYSDVDLSLARGSALIGNVAFSEGGKVESEQVSAFVMAKSGKLVGPVAVSETDDRGDFRIAGLPDGTYYVEVTLGTSIISSAAGKRKPWYWGDTDSITEARSVILHGDDYEGIEIHIPPSAAE